jgi:hypothetical protein
VSLTRLNSTLTAVTFTWEDNSDDGGAEVRDYLVYWDQGDSMLADELFVLADHTAYLTRIHEQAELTNGQHYRFWV